MKNGASKLESIKSELVAQGVQVDNINDLLMLMLSEMRSQNVKIAYGMGAGGTMLGIAVALLIPLIIMH